MYFSLRVDQIILSTIVFCIGLAGVLVRRNLLVILLSIELMLSACNMALVSFSKMNMGLDGQVVFLFVFVIAAAEAAIGLSIIVSLFKNTGSIKLDHFKELKN